MSALEMGEAIGGSNRVCQRASWLPFELFNGTACRFRGKNDDDTQCKQACHMSRAGISPGTSGILWSLSVAAEVVVFLFGRSLLDRIGPAGAAMLSAGAGVVRWAVMAETAWLPAVAAIEPLHGLTFALLHLTCMRLLAQCVPRHLEATALTIYGTVGIGIATALLTLACGPIFERFGAHGFWAMAALCAAALPLALTLREPVAGSR